MLLRELLSFVKRLDHSSSGSLTATVLSEVLCEIYVCLRGRGLTHTLVPFLTAMELGLHLRPFLGYRSLPAG